jgi:phosphoribosyl 1,2-cyclic phosphodiesterase
MTAASSPLPPARGISIQSLGSGSSGNAFLITTATDVVLLDAGVGIRTVNAALKARQMTLADISTICVTHEHSDHVRTLPKVLHADVTLYATHGTAIHSRLPRDRHIRAIADDPIRVGDLTIWPLPVAHDATEPCGFMIELPDGSRATMLTDLGSWHDSLRDFVRASDLVILEANHDEQMLRHGPYPAYLKRRVASDVGHLSNRHCGIALGQALHGASHQPEIWLAHLSQHNNRPGLAEDTVRDALRERDLDLAVRALPRTEPSHIWTPRARTTPAPAFSRKPVVRVQQLGFDGF